jgi:hypothetical protein
LDYVERNLWPQGIAVKSESPAWAEIQGSLSRGDRRVAEAILAVERLTPGNWKQALRRAGLALPELLGARPPDETLPWAMIQGGARARYLAREARRVDAGQTSPPCPTGDCNACGVCG